MAFRIPKRYRKQIRRQGADIFVALLTGIVTNLITDALERRWERRQQGADRPQRLTADE